MRAIPSVPGTHGNGHLTDIDDEGQVNETIKTALVHAAATIAQLIQEIESRDDHPRGLVEAAEMTLRDIRKAQQSGDCPLHRGIKGAWRSGARSEYEAT
jgi:hypothetical protein